MVSSLTVDLSDEQEALQEYSPIEEKLDKAKTIHTKITGLLYKYFPLFRQDVR